MAVGAGEVKTYTAWELAADWWWVGKYLAYTIGGSSGYETATVSKTERTVRISRLIPAKTGPVLTVKQVNIYVDPDRLMELKEV